jgi:hypothetical protein
MPYTPICGGTLLIPSGPAHDPDRKHLHGILTDICNDGLHVLVCIETVIPGTFHDPACEIKAGEHPFCTKDLSFVNYRRADTIRAEKLIRMVDGWTYRPREALSADLLKRMQAGILTSKFTPRRVKDYYRKVIGK